MGAHLASVEISHQQLKRGPIPDAEEMAGYQAIDPQLPTRIMAMAERQAEHRMELEKDASKAQMKDRSAGWTERRLGQVFGLIVALGGLGAGAAVAVLNATVHGAVAGAAIAGVPLLLMVRVMVLGRQKKDQ